MGTKGGEDELGVTGVRLGLATRVALGGAFGGGDGDKLAAFGASEGSVGAALGTGEGGGAAFGTGDGGGGDKLASEEASFWATVNAPFASRATVASLANAAAFAIVAVLTSEAVESKTVMLKAILALARIQLSPQF
ncbi:MAG: hypothetical protein WC028_21495 [Candidatus Obscuribacterales bacterium]